MADPENWLSPEIAPCIPKNAREWRKPTVLPVFRKAMKLTCQKDTGEGGASSAASPFEIPIFLDFALQLGLVTITSV